jgi:hypothetical protein
LLLDDEEAVAVAVGLRAAAGTPLDGIEEALLFDGSWTGFAVFGGPAALAVLVAMPLRKPAASRRKRF